MRTTRLRHYRKANIPLDGAPPSVTATESSEEDPEEEVPFPAGISRHSGGHKVRDDGYLGSESEGDDCQMDGLGEVVSEDELGQDYDSELRINAEKKIVGDTDMEDSNLQEEDLHDGGSEFDEWKEFDEDAEAGLLEHLSDSDRLSEFDRMLDSDDLAADAYEAEGWANRLYFFRIQITQVIKTFLNRQGIPDRRRSRQHTRVQGSHGLKHAPCCL
jgi:hypothetical protein